MGILCKLLLQDVDWLFEGKDIIFLSRTAFDDGPWPRMTGAERAGVLHDVADVLALIEEYPELASAEMVARVQDVRLRLMS